jgi:mRNA interferase RelE/StbE
MTYRVAFEPRAEKELFHLDARERGRILKGIERLAADPSSSPNVKALSGGGYRLRVGDYRVLYTIDAGLLLVLVLRIGHRREAYRRR